jgi:O-antigen/teichoic acid export membrane protein
MVANTVYFLFSLWAAIRYLGRPRLQDLRVRHREQPEELAYRRASFVDDLGHMLLSADFSRLILAAFAGSYQVAIYSVASSIADRLRALIPLEVFRPLVTVTFFKRFEETGTTEEVNRIFQFMFSVNRIVTTAFLVLFIPLGQQVLVWLFREDYGASYLPVVLLLTALAAFSMPIGLVAQTLRRPRLLVYSKLAVLLQVGVAIPLVENYGASGMAVAVALGELVKNLIVFFMLRREFQIQYPWPSTLRFFLAGAVVAAFLWWIQGSVNVFLAGAAGCVAWLLSLRVFSVLNSDEKALIRNIAPDRFAEPVRLLLGS